MSKIGHLFERWITLNSKLEQAVASAIPGGDNSEAEYVRILKEAYGYV